MTKRQAPGFIEHRASGIEYQGLNDENLPATAKFIIAALKSPRLDPVTANIGQIVFDIFVNPFFIGRQRILCTAGPAVQFNRSSVALYPQRRPALLAVEMSIHIQKSFNWQCDRGKYCKDHVLSNAPKHIWGDRFKKI